MGFDDLKNPELQEKLSSAKTTEELLTIVKEEGVELTDDQLDAIAGGGDSWYERFAECPEKGFYG